MGNAASSGQLGRITRLAASSVVQGTGAGLHLRFDKGSPENGTSSSVASSHMTHYHLNIPGDPVAKGRPRATTIGGHARLYTPAKTVSYERRIREAAEAAGVQPIEGPVYLAIYCYWQWPKSKERKRNPREAAWRDSGPDADNVAKAVADALNGVAYQDDRQVCDLRVFKLRPSQGECSCTIVCIKSIDEQKAQPWVLS